MLGYYDWDSEPEDTTEQEEKMYQNELEKSDDELQDREREQKLQPTNIQVREVNNNSYPRESCS